MAVGRHRQSFFKDFIYRVSTAYLLCSKLQVFFISALQLVVAKQVVCHCYGITGLNCVHFCRRVGSPRHRGEPSPRPIAEHIAPWASILLPNTSGSKNIYCTESISMGVISTRTDVISIVCMIALPAAGTRLTCISWVDIYNFNSCKGSLVLDEFC